MRSLRIAAVLLAIVAQPLVASDSPFLHIQQRTQHGQLHLVGKNIAQSPIVAYVVVAARDANQTVFTGVYTAGDSLAAKKSVDMGTMPAGSDQTPARISVDFIRLADGTMWGAATTDQAKEIAARFRQ